MTTRTNLTIQQGETFVSIFQWQFSDGTPVDLSTSTAHMQVRRNFADADRTDPILDITDQDAIELDDEGNIIITLSDTVTEAMGAGTYVYDLELVYEGNVVKLLTGKVNVYPEVTR